MFSLLLKELIFEFYLDPEVFLKCHKRTLLVFRIITSHKEREISLISSIFYGVTMCLFCFFVLRLYGPVNTIKVMISQSVNLLTLFLGRLRPPKQLTST